MKQQFDAILTGTDSPIEGIVNKLSFDGYDDAYEFKSIDNSLHLLIAKNEKGKWQRIAGTEPYLSSWVEELAQQIV